MSVYWTMYFVPAFFAVARLRISTMGWWLLGAALVLFVGLRFQVGADWFTYVEYLDRASLASFIEVLSFKDPGYQILNWVSARLGADVWLVNLVSAALFITGLVKFVRQLKDPRLAFAIAIPYIVIVMGMGYTRQAIAFGLALWGLKHLIRRNLFGFVAIFAIAASFHKSAVILMPLAVLASTERRIWTAFWAGTSGALLFMLFLQEHVDALWQTYVVSDYAQAAQGGPIRVAMNALPAAMFIVLRHRFDMAKEERALWFWVSVFSLLCIPLVFQAPTAVDRVAIYFMPIQLVVFSYLPTLFSANGRVIARLAILGGYGMVMYVWLNFAGHTEQWLPYRFWPLAS